MQPLPLSTSRLITPNRNPEPLSNYSPFPPSPAPGNLQSTLDMNLSVLGISCK